MIELFGAIAALKAISKSCRGQSVLILVDSETAEGALTRRVSSAIDMSACVSEFWSECVQHDLHVYVGRVPTDANPADEPSRGRLHELERRGATWVSSQLEQ